jgi:hypothetical protein
VAVFYNVIMGDSKTITLDLELEVSLMEMYIEPKGLCLFCSLRNSKTMIM